MIAGDPVHAGGMQGGTAKKVASANDQPDLNADTDQLADFQRHPIQHLGIDTETLGAHQGLTA